MESPATTTGHVLSGVPAAIRKDSYDPVSCLFNPVLFIADGDEQALADAGAFPYLYNDNGRGVQSDVVQGNLIEMAEDDPALEMGQRYTNISWEEKRIPTETSFYTIKEFDFHAKEVRYEGLWATARTAQAFGMTLLKNGECVRFPYKDLVRGQYTYGKWAGHQSPYIDIKRRRELLTVNATDLEYHKFAHVFFSQDRLPLVISVARWRPLVHEITLADLWLRPGDALVLPPQSGLAMEESGLAPRDPRLQVVNLHGNRNSALACWFADDQSVIRTETFLANAEVMAAAATKPHYHEEKAATRHEPPAG